MLMVEVGLRRTEMEGSMADVEKCAHPACQCRVAANGTFGKYCSEHCQEAADLTEVKCDCKHPECG